MLKVAITGNIASGKSLVEEFLEEKSYKVLDSDTVAHGLLNNENVKKQIISVFMDYDIFENDEISRFKLGQIVFAKDDLRKKLESILHPLVKEEIKRFFRSCESEKIAFVSVPLLFEAKLEILFDKIILIYTDDKIRLERLIKRNNLSTQNAENRLKSQLCQDDKVSLADYVIYNNKTPNILYENIEKILEILK